MHHLTFLYLIWHYNFGFYLPVTTERINSKYSLTLQCTWQPSLPTWSLGPEAPKGCYKPFFASVASVYSAPLMKKLFPIYIHLQELPNMEYLWRLYIECIKWDRGRLQFGSCKGREAAKVFDGGGSHATAWGIANLFGIGDSEGWITGWIRGRQWPSSTADSPPDLVQVEMVSVERLILMAEAQEIYHVCSADLSPELVLWWAKLSLQTKISVLMVEARIALLWLAELLLGFFRSMKQKMLVILPFFFVKWGKYYFPEL